jgi:transcriptional regulator with XRE-family HTH domain
VRRQDPERVLKDIGRRVAEIRCTHGMTQERFAEEVLGMSLKYLQAVEAGRENLTVASLVKLANLVRIPVAELFVPPKTRAVKRGRPPLPPRGRGLGKSTRR